MHNKIFQLIREGLVMEADARAATLLQQRPDDLKSWSAWGACQLAKGNGLAVLTAECKDRKRAMPQLLAPAFYLALLQRHQGAHAECIETLIPIARTQPKALLRHPKIVACFVEACLATDDPSPAFLLHEAADSNLASSNPDLWRCNPVWWSRFEGRSLNFRRIDGSDAMWLKQVFSAPLFAQQVNRSYASKVAKMPVSSISKELARQTRQAPADLGALMLTVEDRHSRRPIGLASFVSIDPLARQSELVVGFTEDQTSLRIAELSCFLVYLAFDRLRFRRVITSIYSSNPKLMVLKSTLRKFGFEDEGVLRAHSMESATKFSDVHLMGCLGQEAREAESVLRHLRRHGPWTEVYMRGE